MLSRPLRLVSIILSFGLVLVIERLSTDPKWKRIVWALIVANEIRGCVTVYYGGATLWHSVLG